MLLLGDAGILEEKPVIKLSTNTIEFSFFSANFSAKQLGMNPAPPVTNIFAMTIGKCVYNVSK